MTILLLGANGQVGRELRRALAHVPARESTSPFGKIIVATRNGASHDGSHCETADLSRPETLPILLDRVRPDVIVNAAAYTAVDRAEDEPELAQRVNAEAVDALARWAAAHAALVVHYSTDYVFDGTDPQPRREVDATAPLGVYGASKLAGEQALRASGARHVLLRTAWVYAAHGHNFLQTMLRLSAERDHLAVVDDQHGTPTPAWLIADVTATVLDRWHAAEPARRPELEGTFHLVAGGQTTWCGFARAIMQRAVAAGLLEHAPRVEAITTDAFPTRAQRPAWAVLDTTRLTTTFGLGLPTWQTGLDRVMAQLVRTRAEPL